MKDHHMLPINTAVAAARPAFVGFVKPAMGEGVKLGIQALAGLATFYAVGGAAVATGYCAYRGGRAIVPATRRLLHRINPVRHLIDTLDRRMEEALYHEVSAWPGRKR